MKLNPDWKWADGEPVTSRDVVFWMNMLKASPATEWCGYVPGYFPDNVTSYSAPNASTVVFHLNKAYNPTYFTLQRARADHAAPAGLGSDIAVPAGAQRPTMAIYRTRTKAGAAAVYKFLDGESKKLGSWASSPLWSVVDGPFKLQSFTSTAR